MKIIYLVTSGEYSDYMFHAAFTDKERALQYKEAIAADDVEELQLDPEDDCIHHPQGYKAWRITMDKNGKVLNSCQFDIRDFTNENPVHCEKNDRYYFDVVAASSAHAIKIVNEKRAQMIAITTGKKHTPSGNQFIVQ